MGVWWKLIKLPMSHGNVVQSIYPKISLFDIHEASLFHSFALSPVLNDCKRPSQDLGGFEKELAELRHCGFLVNSPIIAAEQY